MHKNPLPTFFLALFIVIALASCSGGGGGAAFLPATQSYSVSAIVSGLTGTGLVLQNNGAGDISVASNGTYTFSSLIKDRTGYAVTVKQHATAPVQKCLVTNGTGVVFGGNVTGISVVCQDAYLLSGSVSTLSGPGLVLRNNGADDLAVVSNGSFTFATPLLDTETYSVTVRTQPSTPPQVCGAFSGSGTITGADVTSISVKCTSNNYAFVTSTSQNGNLGGLAGADALCAARATAAQLPGTFVAWLSTSTVHAKDRLGSARGWIRTDGKPFAGTVQNLTAEDGRINYPLRLTESGSDVGKNILTLTGTNFDGTASGDTCSDWTSADIGVSAMWGFADAGTLVWTVLGTASCDTPRPIYCFGTDISDPWSPPSAVPIGRRAFVSAGTFAPNAGLAAADGLCQSEATAAGLTGSYKALLATDGASAASRFTTATGTAWARLDDGIPIVAAAADLATDLLLAPLNRTPGGLYLGNSGVVVGATSFSTAGTAASTCSDWSSTSGSFQAGIAARSAIGGGAESCASTHLHLYCLEE